MNATNKTALELVHRLLFRALIEIRAQGHEQKNQLVFHLADLFHNLVLDMEAAAELDRTIVPCLYRGYQGQRTPTGARGSCRAQCLARWWPRAPEPSPR